MSVPIDRSRYSKWRIHAYKRRFDLFLPVRIYFNTFFVILLDVSGNF